MRIDVLTIFPDYLAPLDLSLVGKARRSGLLDLAVHDLRDWTADRHRTVDDTPFGGGAGMVMRPDVWGEALDAVLADDDAGQPAVLLVPGPGGEVLTQRTAEELAGARRLVIACGRYEGIDARVAEHYATRPGVEVREISIGDYVLNGGEVAALVVIEAVARLLPGVVGNPESLVEESHGAAGLLEYPVYTKPPEWRGHAVPEVLTSGHHGKVARWRRDRALERTAARRPDLLARLAPDALDPADRRVLADLGWYVAPEGPRRAVVRPAEPADTAALAALAAATFPLACPPSLGADAVAAFVATHLDEASFARYLTDPQRLLHVAADEVTGALLGYTMVVLDSPRPGLEEGAGSAELSKCYVRPDVHGSGLARRLLAACTAAAGARGAETIWLGTNVANRRARRFYERSGFTVVGRRTFDVGGVPNDDVVLSTPITVG
ncbi:tRNA (guanosine(37)-N1)-methyltransferase TrmD [Georgenia wutianyii]|uniref:tRNA (guanine-N(1)-)-methyltransferase n=1 Tax=Georgenia wutianyii TaxID=2585135 RepID=A0ABX5VN64_9MICO|nr:tRNA (guanosine(37)-N1)-methyltransferase TrmD [Georgenia wutianyii]